MGISGLLPLLKSIQVNKHLSECSGQTLAVDAYVWLHRGVHSCATELATGKKTNKYVDYAMHRVRLLRHHKIQPYVVFDGGPLPAKKGTEVERKQRRDENLAKGNALAAQGKHSDARDYYVKCIDVTPQMAYQLIKALRAEDIPYIVAPYEADAQLAYLERIGLVDGIITEDSDLLVYGCRKVYFKLDAVSATMTCISRSDFAANEDISLAGWSDVQFRAMAILSGCDYLPSIPGIGLKTAWALLRKSKTVENVIRAVRLEGKKAVPKEYLKAFRLAENVFLHQRVYDPVSERLVHLNDVPEDAELDEATLAYMGGDMDPADAKRVSLGDADPVTLLTMEDINPGYVARVPLKSTFIPISGKGKGKAVPSGKSASEGILHFLVPKPKVDTSSSKPKSSSQPVKKTMVVGKASGKRTLADAMDYDIAARKKIRDKSLSPAKPRVSTESRFFATGPQATALNKDHTAPIAGPSRIHDPIDVDKENIPIAYEDEDLDFAMVEPEDPVTQEDGYMSPSPSLARLNTPELSSPLRPGVTRKRDSADHFDDFDEDVLSSPDIQRIAPPLRPPAPIGRLDFARKDVPALDSPPLKTADNRAAGPDLRDMFSDDQTSDIDCFEEDKSPVTPDDNGQTVADTSLDLDLDDSTAALTRKEVVAQGWWEKWGHSGKDKEGRFHRPTLVRRETNVTPAGRHTAIRPSVNSAPAKLRPQPRLSDGRSKARHSLVFFQDVKDTPRRELATRPLESGSSGSDLGDEDITKSVKMRFEKFR
ncbi:hypothetical protein HWV62_42213 [Athelia sp. TMB]|nr:hypothetical protein HWV62_42213 [Athelia sp. TMB]